MKTNEAIEICESWFDFLDNQAKRAITMQQLAAQARKGPDEAKKAQAKLRQMDRTPTVYDGGRLRPAVEHLITAAQTGQKT